jgi:trk system potassium uptake protein TrkA
MAEIILPREWVGKSLAELKLRERHHINIIAVKTGDTMDINPLPDEPLREGCILMAIGKNKDLNKYERQR